jgi:MoxR-like ATPase
MSAVNTRRTPLARTMTNVATLPQLDPPGVAEVGERLRDNIRQALKVRDEVVRDLLVALLADGHILIEDYPGVGKTALARALARSIDAEYARIQCTADLLPADVIGTNVFDRNTSRFEFHPGPVFANVVLVDEINRASPKTQSGLLECMQERRVTIDRESHQLARPFLVIATQNPIEYEGTYPLPEAQLDRFTVRLSLGYPSADDEADMFAQHAEHDRVLDLEAVADLGTVLAAQEAAAAVHASEPLRRYVVALCEGTRSHDGIELGASPRAGLMLFRAAKAHAALEGRDHALPDDVQALAVAVLAHRLLLGPGVDGREREAVVRDVVERVPAL